MVEQICYSLHEKGDDFGVYAAIERRLLMTSQNIDLPKGGDVK
jgi:hypothetical protein